MQETVELNITAFLNLMVILVPFLLITAVFSRMTVLELNLPALEAIQKENQEIKLALQVLITEDALVIQDATLGEIKRLPMLEGEDVNWKIFTDVLIEIKSRFPEEQNIALLMKSSVPYKTMISVMDHVRYAEIVNVTSLELVELFPNVSIGDAPLEQAENAETEAAGGAQ
ncbi:Biopolymer transport protein ExbD [Alteromonadaceae bacterium Bs31]|nr:Biopolymer transport protein ExbD [Alteromonadaceae bacterium Bs31]